MFNKIIVYLKNYDWILFSSVILLLSFGLSEIYSIALGQDQVDLLNFKKQLLFVLIGMVLMFSVSFIDYHNIRSFSNYIYLGGILMLVLVLFFGRTIRNTTGWFSIGPFNIQPSEFVKIVIVVYLAKYFSTISVKVNMFKHLIVSGISAAILVFLILAQPDFGSAMIIFLIWLTMIAIVGFEKRYFLVIALVLLVSFAGAWAFFFEDYQRERIMTFMGTSADPLDRDYNITQATIAIGSGRLMGRGIGFGSQSQLKFLPESQNDFIFAVIAEELGFLGVCLILGFFSVFFYRLIKNVRYTKDDFGTFFLLGAGSLIFIEMFINIGMNISLMPVIGVSLPFVSYGGSGIISSLLLLGIIQSIIIRSKLTY